MGTWIGTPRFDEAEEEFGTEVNAGPNWLQSTKNGGSKRRSVAHTSEALGLGSTGDERSR
ncbi:MAG: hypothetical protein VKI42_04365 [Synechococcaceae cyanobacterium]|nr:hypothetical protein [Synechococcaceae cyanobacterium]